MIVQYYADSLGLSRPGAVGLHERYIYLFEEWLKKHSGEDVFVINRARRGFTIDKLYEVFNEDEEYIDGEKDILLIHEGVCDCAPRPVSPRMRKFISGLPGFIRKRVIHYLHNNRAKLLKRGSVHYLVSKSDYERILTEWLGKAIKKFKRIYLFTIAPTNAGIEAHSPGFGASITAYNEIIKRVAGNINDQKVHVVDVHAVIAGVSSLDDYIIKEDGHHITALAHAMYANKLIELEQQRLQ
jgi:hypothetical protein